MATIKVSEASGPVLDWLVMKIEFDRYAAQGDSIKSWVSERHSKGDPCGQPSTDWTQGGPIIERERIRLSYHNDGVRSHATLIYPVSWNTVNRAFGPTPLVAAMRCHVASKLGDTAEVPDELLNS